MGCWPFDVRLVHPLLFAGLSRRTNRRLTPVLPLTPFVPEAARHETSRSAGDVALAEAAPARALDLGTAVGVAGHRIWKLRYWQRWFDRIGGQPARDAPAFAGVRSEAASEREFLTNREAGCILRW